MSRRSIIDDLRLELKKLNIASRNIEKTVLLLEEKEKEQPQEQQQQQQQQRKDKAPTNRCPTPDLRPRDRDGVEIRIGDRVLFLTKGVYSSTEGIVNRFSRNSVKVFALDCEGVEVPRAPRNVRVLSDE